MISLLSLLKTGVISLLLVTYMAISYLAYKGLGDLSFISFVRHVVLVAGFVPLICWLTVFLALKNNGKLFLLATGVTLFHFVVFAVSAHTNGFPYWSLQLVEIVTLRLLVIIFRKY